MGRGGGLWVVGGGGGASKTEPAQTRRPHEDGSWDQCVNIIMQEAKSEGEEGMHMHTQTPERTTHSFILKEERGGALAWSLKALGDSGCLLWMNKWKC